MRRAWLIALVLALAAPVAAAAPQRIISLAPSVTETLFALGVGERVVGVSTYCDYPEAATHVDKVGTFLQPNVERILAKQPDLVIAVPSPGNRAPVERLRDLGLPVLIVDPERIAEILEAVRRIADAVGEPEAGARLVADIERDVRAVEARVAGVEPVRALLLVGRAPFIAAGAGTYQDELVTRAGGTNIAAGSGQRWPNLSLELIVAQAPQVIIDASMGSEEAADGAASVAFWSDFPTIPAVRDRRIHGYRAYELLRPGPRVAQTLATVARFLHPERFASADP
ncbi:ABC transporter substrate-binding protein [bacterium]|nr:ABC transporter substrate-binding protein [bacterium]